MLTEYQVNFLKLVDRCPKDAEGWAAVNPMLWPHIQTTGLEDLVEFDRDKSRVSFTDHGEVVMKHVFRRA